MAGKSGYLTYGLKLDFIGLSIRKMSEKLYHNIHAKMQQGERQLAVLIDPDKLDNEQAKVIGEEINKAPVDYIFVGGSLLTKDCLDACLDSLRAVTSKPLILFPGSSMQVSAKADAILFLSLISGRNPDLLIGQQVIAAPYVKQSGLEVLPTGYMLIDSGSPTTASYMSGSLPIPANKPEIAAVTAMAGEMLGMKLMYMDGGSGADNSLNTATLQAVRKAVKAPIIVGGGVTSSAQAEELFNAGASVVVVGNALEKDPKALREISLAVV